MELQFIGWGVAAALGLFMVYRHIMHKMQAMKREVFEDIRTNTEFVKAEFDWVRTRCENLDRRIQSVDSMHKSLNKEKAPTTTRKPNTLVRC
jgi:hypothetical protein